MVMSYTPTIYVDATNGLDTNDGSSALQAYQTVAAAMAAATNGDVIFFAPGDYTGTPINLPSGKALTFVSANAGVDPDSWTGGEVILDRIVSLSSVTVDGIHIHVTIGGAGDTTSSNGPYWQGVGTSQAGLDVTVKNSIITGEASGSLGIAQPFGLNLTYGGGDVVIDHVHFGAFTGLPPTNTAYGVWINRTDPGSSVTITNNVFETGAPRNAAIAFDAQHDGPSVVITGNSFEDPGTSPGAIRFFDFVNGVSGTSSYPNITGNSMTGDGPIISNELGTPLVVNSNDVVTGTGANETFVADGGNDTVDGGDGTDTYDMTDGPGGVVDLNSGYSVSSNTGFDSLVNIENAKGSSGNDVFIGNGGDNVFVATVGGDTFNGNGNGANGDTFDASAAATAITVNLNGGTTSGAFTTNLSNVENVKTGAGNDTITLSSATNNVDGGAGVDTAITTSSAYSSTAITWNETDDFFQVGADKLTSVEKVEMSDRGVWLVRDEAELANALASAGVGDVIVLAPREYDMDVTLKSGVDIRGLSEEDVIINGAIVVPAGLTDVEVKGLTVHNASATGYLLDMRSASNSTVTDIVFEDVTFELTSDFIPAGPGTNGNDAPIGNSYARGTINVADGDSDGAGLTFKNVTMDSGDKQIGTFGNELAMFQVGSVGGAKILMDGVQVNGLNTNVASLGAQLNISGNNAADVIDFVNGGTSDGGNLYISGFEDILVDNNVFNEQGLALNGPKHAEVTGNTFQNIDGTIKANNPTLPAEAHHRGLTIEDAWGTDGASDLTITGNTFTNITAPDGAIAFQRFTDGGTATIDNLNDVTIANNTFTSVNTPIHLNATYFGSGAALPADFDGDHFVLATGGNDDIEGTAGADIIFTDAGNDTVEGAAGNDTVDGGAGVDDAVFDADYDTATITESGGTFSVTSTGEGTDAVTNVERAVFTNGDDDDTTVWLVDEASDLTYALANAANGDIIKLAAGTYVGNFSVISSVTIESASGDAGDVILSGNLRGLNGLDPEDSVAAFLKTRASDSDYISAGNGLSISANDVTIRDITISEYSVGIALQSQSGLLLEDVDFTSNQNAIRKGTTVEVSDFDWTGGTVSDGWGGLTVYAGKTGPVGSRVGVGTFDDILIDGVTFSNLNYKGLYFEQLSNALIDNVDMDNVGQWGAVTDGRFGAGIDINLKYKAYAGIEIRNFEFTDVGASLFGDALADATGGAIVVKARDDGSDYGDPVSTLTGVNIHDGSIDGTSTGIRFGEPGKTTAGPSNVTVTDVTITDALIATYDNQTTTTRTVTLTESADTVTVTGLTGAFHFIAGGGTDNVTGGVGNDTIEGEAGNDTLDGGSGNDTILGGADDDSILGGSGSDSITGGAGSDIMNAGESASDNDVAVFELAINNYSITYNSTTDTYTVTQVGGGQVDSAKGFETLRFGGTDYFISGNEQLVINDNNPVFNDPDDVVAVISENVADAFVTDAGATDADSNSIFGPVVYTLEGGTDKNSFNISASGIITFAGSADRELKASYSFSVKATQGTTSTVKNVSVTISDVNDTAPVISSLATIFVDENTPASTFIHTAAATDADPTGGTVTYGISGGDSAAFTINSTTGQIKFNTSPDFETKQSYTFDIVASQTGGGPSTTQTFIVNVNNLPENALGVEIINVSLEEGTTKSALPNVTGGTVDHTFDVSILDLDGGTAYLANGTVLTEDMTGLTLADINGLTLSSGSEGNSSIQFVVHRDGFEDDVLNYNITVTEADDALYEGGSGSNRLDGAAGDDTVEGNGGNDTIFGGSGRDSILAGSGNDEIHGGIGKDTLNGGTGADKFVFDTALSANNADRIIGFSRNNDKIVLDNDIFVALGSSLTSSEFWKNSTGNAHDSTDHIIYQTTTGKLFFDIDGKGGEDKVLIATLDNKASITLDDFLVV